MKLKELRCGSIFFFTEENVEERYLRVFHPSAETNGSYSFVQLFKPEYIEDDDPFIQGFQLLTSNIGDKEVTKVARFS